MRVPAALALAALATAPAAALGQWRASPMVVPVPPGADVLPGRYGGAGAGEELLVVDRATGTSEVRAHGALLVADRLWTADLPAATPVRTGRTLAFGGDALSDAAYGVGAQLVVRYGAAPSTAVSRPGPARVASFAHLVAHAADSIVSPSPDVGSGAGWIQVVDDDASAFASGASVRTWTANGLAPLERGEAEVFGLSLSPAATAAGLDDLALPTGGGVFLLVHRPATPDLRYVAPPGGVYAGLALEEVRVGGPSALERPPWLPAFVARKGDALGAAALDVDGDGFADLVFAYGSTLDVPDGRGGFLPNHLVVVRGGPDPRALASAPWEDLGAEAALEPLRDPALVRRVTAGGAPAVAVWDRDLDEVVVISSGNGLHAWRGAARGRRLRDLRTADLVGSPAPDLVAVGEADVLVYPDVGDASPLLAWSPGSPGTPERGVDHRFSVTASDADGDVVVAWLVGDPAGPPAATVVVPAGQAGTAEHLVAGALLCEPPPQTLAVTVRATDALGVFEELSARLDVPFPPPLLALSGAAPDGRLPLPVEGTAALLEGAAGSRCGATAFAWSGSLFDAVPGFEETTTAEATRRVVPLPVESYPALLAVAEPDVALVALDGGVPSEAARLVLDLDARGLVEVAGHSADVTALEPGEVAVLRTVVRSRIAAPLPAVRVVDHLRGLAPAGPPRVTGAGLAGTGRGGAEVVLDALPGAGAEVVIELPVRSAGGRGASAVEVRSAGGHLLTAAAHVPGDGATTPGCGCGGPDAGAGALLVLAALARRRRAT